MDYIIQFPQSDYWRPKDLRGIYIEDIKVVKARMITKSGFIFSVVEGKIPAEVATFLKLKDIDSRIKIRIDK